MTFLTCLLYTSRCVYETVPREHRFPLPMTVIYQTTEDEADDTVVPRFNSAGGDGDRLSFIKEYEKGLTLSLIHIRCV